MKDKKFHALRKMLSARLHNMWPEEYGTWENAIDDYCEQASADQLLDVILQLRGIIRANLDEDTLAVIVNYKCHGNIHPPGISLTYQQWLEVLEQMIDQWIQKKVH
jgi:hypothetical protein